MAEDSPTANSVYRWLPPVTEFIDEVNKAEHTEAEAIAAQAADQPYYLCSRCVEQEDKGEMKFGSSWRRSRRPTTKIAVAAL